ncbi:MAG TPA: glycine oxidase ThiO, partial [Streptosporangiaceae bacterium]|nr:glycine oxidase ThiO [Streptosporangiaceae bacterium]
MTSAVVIGGGVIGLSVAWRAAQRGLAVTVIDPAPGNGATRAAAGMLTPVTEAAYAEKDLLRLGIESLRRYPDFAAELTRLTGEPTGFRQDGTMQVGYDADDMAVIGEVQALQEAFGVAAQRLTARECRAAEPLLDPAVRGGLLTAGDGSVDPRRLVGALLAAAGLAGVTTLRQPAAEVIVTGGEAGRAATVPSASGRAAGVRLADGTEVAADWVVLAAGWESAGLAGLPPAAVPPVRPVKGQILRLRAGPQAGQLSRSVRGVVRGRSVYLVPRLDSELVIGATQEEMGADTRVTAGGVWELLRDARTLIPAITEFGFAEACAGLRPGTPDNAPVLGPSGLPGLVLATGHFRAGVLLAPITAEAVAEYLV